METRRQLVLVTDIKGRSDEDILRMARADLASTWDRFHATEPAMLPDVESPAIRAVSIRKIPNAAYVDFEWPTSIMTRRWPSIPVDTNMNEFTLSRLEAAFS